MLHIKYETPHSVYYIHEIVQNEIEVNSSNTEELAPFMHACRIMLCSRKQENWLHGKSIKKLLSLFCENHGEESVCVSVVVQRDDCEYLCRKFGKGESFILLSSE
jgi:hypothetical protein